MAAKDGKGYLGEQLPGVVTMGQAGKALLLSIDLLGLANFHGYALGWRE